MSIAGDKGKGGVSYANIPVAHGGTADDKVSGQSVTAAYLLFESADIENGYYIKVIDAGKYINHNGAISRQAPKSLLCGPWA